LYLRTEKKNNIKHISNKEKEKEVGNVLKGGKTLDLSILKIS